MAQTLYAVGVEPNGRPWCVLDFALAYAGAGLSVIPIRRDGSKAPPAPWKRWQSRPADEAQLRRWFDLSDPPGLAIVCGAVSGGLEVIDFDDPDSYPTWCELVEEQTPGLLGRLPVVQTPRGGAHVYYRCAAPGGNQKLAKDASGKTLIETRGEGGYVLAPGCPPQCHPSGGLYVAVDSALGDAPALDAAERELLLAVAASFNQAPHASAERDGSATGGRPGDEFNAWATWEEILTPHGWEAASRHGDATYWRRPGKAGRCWSATTGYCRGKDGQDLLYVFSSNAAPFESQHTYSRFAAYALLNHAGDFKTAARALGDAKRDRTASNVHGTQGADAAATSTSAGDKKQDGKEIILEWLRKTYDPTFRRGMGFYSNRLSREVKVSQACFAPTGELVDRLMAATDAPKHSDTGKARRNDLPKFFQTWAKVAAVDLLDSLPEEDDGAEVTVAAAEEFRAKVAAVLHTIVSMGYRRKADDKQKAPETEVERRALLDWCVLWAKPGKWTSIRSYRLWVKRYGESEQVRIALRPELFGQVGKDAALGQMGQNRFGRLCERYDVGVVPDQKVAGARCVELSPEFVSGLLTTPREPDEPADSVDETPRACAHARMDGKSASAGEKGGESA